MSTFKLPQTAFALALLASVWPMANAAYAADLDPGYADVPAPITQQQLTFGSGWYVRGDLGVTRLPTIDTNQTSSSEAPAVTLGKGSRVGYIASLGGGYQVNRYFRTDAVFDFHQPVHSTTNAGNISCLVGYTQGPVNGYTTTTTANGTVTTPNYLYTPMTNTCNGINNGRIYSYDALINGYFDVGTWYGITPYVGAGVGLAFGRYSGSTNYFQGDGTSYDFQIQDPNTGSTYRYYYDKNYAGTYYNFAFALMAGVAYDVYDHTKLDIGYRYLNQGKVLGTTLESHEIRAGLRYMIDN